MAEPTTSQIWVDLLDADADTIAAAFPGGLHASVAARLQALPRHDDEPRPRLEAHGEYLFGVLVIPTPSEGDRDVVFHEVDLVMTRTELVTARRTPTGGAPVDLEAVRRGALASAATPGMCLYLLFDEVAERYLSLVDGFDADIDELEDAVEEWAAARLRGRISELRHDILNVRRTLAPTRDAARAVLDERVELDGEPSVFPREVQIHFADAYDKLLRATDGLDLSRDLLAGVRDYHQAQVSNDQNEVMKRLTVVASVLLLPTFIVGLYGQNVRGVPEYHFRYGYLWSWTLIVLTTVLQVIYFRRKRWI